MSSFISWHFVLVPTNGGASTEEVHCLSAQELEVQNLGVVGWAPSGGSDSELRDGTAALPEEPRPGSSGLDGWSSCRIPIRPSPPPSAQGPAPPHALPLHSG